MAKHPTDSTPEVSSDETGADNVDALADIKVDSMKDAAAALIKTIIDAGNSVRRPE